MNRIIAIITGVIALGGLAAVPATARAQASSVPQVRTFIAAYPSRTAVRPALITVDGMHDVLWELRWSSWTGTSARGTGYQMLNNCTPSCARGKVVNIRVTVVLSLPGRGLFTRMTETDGAGHANRYDMLDAHCLSDALTKADMP